MKKILRIILHLSQNYRKDWAIKLTTIKNWISMLFNQTLWMKNTLEISEIYKIKLSASINFLSKLSSTSKNWKMRLLNLKVKFRIFMSNGRKIRIRAGNSRSKLGKPINSSIGRSMNIRIKLLRWRRKFRISGKWWVTRKNMWGNLRKKLIMLRKNIASWRVESVPLQRRQLRKLLS